MDITYKTEQSSDVRCCNCGKLLAKEAMGDGKIELKCPKCKKLNKVTFSEFGERYNEMNPGSC